jgi:hypothetical protein
MCVYVNECAWSNSMIYIFDRFYEKFYHWISRMTILIYTHIYIQFGTYNFSYNLQTITAGITAGNGILLWDLWPGRAIIQLFPHELLVLGPLVGAYPASRAYLLKKEININILVVCIYIRSWKKDLWIVFWQTYPKLSCRCAPFGRHHANVLTNVVRT